MKFNKEAKMMPVYNKLVRDRIPEIIRKDHKECTTEILDDERYVVELKKKLVEELEEYQEATTDEEALEELADMLELMYALAETHGSNIEKVEEIRKDMEMKILKNIARHLVVIFHFYMNTGN